MSIFNRNYIIIVYINFWEDCSMGDLRLEERIPVDILSEEMRSFIFSSGLFHEHQAVLINASRNGLSFVAENVEYQKYEIGQQIKIKFFPQDINLKAKIVYLIKLSEKSVKFGVNFIGASALDNFHKLLDQNK